MEIEEQMDRMARDGTDRLMDQFGLILEKIEPAIIRESVKELIFISYVSGMKSAHEWTIERLENTTRGASNGN